MTQLVLSTFVLHPAFAVCHFLPVFPTLSWQQFFLCVFWLVVLLVYTVTSSFHLFSLSTSPRAPANNGVLKKHSSCHFSGVSGSRRLHLVCRNSILILNIGVNEVFAQRTICPLSYISIRTFENCSVSFNDTHKPGILS